MKTVVTTLGTCGVCERSIAVDPAGRLVHHGYKRPGVGQIVGDCFAVGYEPYERSTKACEAYQALRQKGVERADAYLARLAGGEVTYLRDAQLSSKKALVITEYAVGVTELYRFASRLENEQRKTQRARAMDLAEIDRMAKLIAGFELTELGTETRAGAKERAEKDARAAERAAKKAVRDAKRATLDAKRAAKAEKLAQLSRDLVEGLETIAAKAEAVSARREAEALIERVSKACRKTPKVSIHTPDLGRADLFLRLGLADQPRGDGWVNYGKVWDVE